METIRGAPFGARFIATLSPHFGSSRFPKFITFHRVPSRPLFGSPKPHSSLQRPVTCAPPRSVQHTVPGRHGIDPTSHSEVHFGACAITGQLVPSISSAAPGFAHIQFRAIPLRVTGLRPDVSSPPHSHRTSSDPSHRVPPALWLGHRPRIPYPTSRRRNVFRARNGGDRKEGGEASPGGQNSVPGNCDHE